MSHSEKVNGHYALFLVVSNSTANCHLYKYGERKRIKEDKGGTMMHAASVGEKVHFQMKQCGTVKKS